MKGICLLVALFVISGCGVVAMVQSNSDLKDSKAAYKRCLEQNQDDPSKCEALKRAYHADLKEYQEQLKRNYPFVSSGNISVDKD